MILTIWRYLLGVLVLLVVLLPEASEAQVPTPLAQPNLDLRYGESGVTALALPDGGAIVTHRGRIVGGDIESPQLFRVLPNGSIDPAWVVRPNGIIMALAVAGDELYLAGAFTEINDASRRGLARLSVVTGELSEWNPNDGSTVSPGLSFRALAVVDDALYVGGNFTQVGITSRMGLAKIDRQTGDLDLTFNPAVTGTVEAIRSDNVALFVAGAFSAINGVPRANAAKISLTEGILDAAWAPSFNSDIRAIEVDAGWLYAVGCFSQVNGTSRNRVARIATSGDGAIDSTWHPAPNGVCVNAVDVDANHVYLGGEFTQLGGNSRTRVGRVSKTGSGMLDAEWTPIPDGAVTGVRNLSGGSVLITGQFVEFNGEYQPGVARVDASSGASLGPAVYSEGGGIVRQLVAAPDGGIYVGGSFDRVAGAELMRRGVLRVTPAGELDTSWALPLSGDRISNAFAMALAANADHLYIGGAFSIPGLPDGTNLIRVNHEGVIDTSWTPGPTSQFNFQVQVNAMAIDSESGTIFVGGSFSQIGGQDRSRLAEIDLVTGQATAFNPGLNGEVRALLLDGDDLYVGGGFTTIGGVDRQRLAKLDRNGVVDTHFVADANNSVRGLLLGPGDTLYVGGWFSNISGFSRTGLARLFRSSGAPDPSWGTFPNGWVYGLSAASDGFYLGGDFAEVGGVARARVARVSHQGVVAPLFAPGGDHWIRIKTALEQGSKVTLGGWLNWFESAPGIRRGMAAFPLNATPIAPVLTITSSLPNNTQPHQFYRVEVNGVAGGLPLVNQLITVDCDSGAFCEAFLDSQGNGGCELASLTPGTRTLTARFGGTELLLPATTTGTHQVAGIAATPPANPAFDLRSPGFMGGFLNPGMVRTADGKLVIAGTFNRVGDSPQRGLARLLPDGSADPGFRADVLGGVVRSVAADASNNLFAVGSFGHINNVFRPRLAKLNSEGNVIPAWVPARTDVNVEFAHVDSAGDLIVGGFLFGSGSPIVVRQSLIKLSGVDGQELNFDVTVTRTSTSPLVRVSGDDSYLYVYGQFDEVNGVPRRNLARLSLTGELDLNWDPSPDFLVRSVVPDGAGGVYVAGDFTEIANQNARARLVRLSSTGTVVAAFNPAPSSSVETVIRDGQSLYVGGFFGNIGGLFRPVQAKIDATTGAADAGFQPQGLTPSRFQRLGDALWAPINIFTMTATDVRFMGALRQDAISGQELQTATLTRPAEILALARQPDGATLIGGRFARLGSSQRNLVRITPEGVFDTGFAPPLAAALSVRALMVRGNGDIYVGDDVGLRKLDAGGGIDPVFASPNSAVLSLADAGDGLIAGGFFTTVGSPAVDRNRIAKLDYETGAAVAGWDPDADASVRALAIGPDGAVYLGGDFTIISGQPRARLAKLHPDGSLNSLWQPQPNSSVNALLVDGADVYAGGFFSAINGITRRGLAKFAAGNGALADWAPGGTTAFPIVYALARAQDGGILVGGQFRTMGGAFRSNAAKIDPVTGLADPLWNPSLDGPVFAILAGYGNTPAASRLTEIEQNIAMGGSFEFQGATPMPGFVAVPSVGRPTTDGLFCDRFATPGCVPPL